MRSTPNFPQKALTFVEWDGVEEISKSLQVASRKPRDKRAVSTTNASRRATTSGVEASEIATVAPKLFVLSRCRATPALPKLNKRPRQVAAALVLNSKYALAPQLTDLRGQDRR